jgi:TPR repeat protein
MLSPNCGVGAAMRFDGLWRSESRGQIRNVPGRPWRDASRDCRRYIRALTAQVGAVKTRRDVAALEQRVNTLIAAINSSRAVGEVLPRDLEKLLAKLVRKLRRARVKRRPRPYEFVQAARNVAAGVGLAFSLFVSLHIADQSGLFDQILSVLAEQAQSLLSSWSPAQPTSLVAQANQATLEPPSPPTPNPPAGMGGGAAPSWAVPEITGTLLPGTGRSGTLAEVKLPAAVGNPALRAAALAGDPAAAYEVASRFAEARGVPQSHEEEARWLERAAAQGLAPAQFLLGGLFEKGVGVGKDLARARDLYLGAAQKGNAKAMHNLAVLYAEGVNGAPDFPSAAGWFRKAADHGIKDSQYNLAIFYGRGVGVTQDYAESYKWFSLAANQGDADAATKRDEVAKYLDPQMREALRRAAQSWVPQPQPDDAINVRTQAAWGAPGESPRPLKPQPRPAGGDTRTAESRTN